MPSRRPVVALAMALLFLAPSRSAMAQGAKGLEQAEPPDPEDDAPAVAEATTEWQLQTEPWTFIVDAEGRIAARFEGVASAEELRDAIQQTLG